MAYVDQYDGHQHYDQTSQPQSLQGDSPPLSKAQPLRNAYDLSYQGISPIMSRSPSNASDRFSTVSAVTTQLPSTPQNVHPAPAFVAPFGAAQVVSDHQAANKRSESDDDEAKPNKSDVQFSEPALALVNAFLDQLLFGVLSAARSTTLTALRPAVTDVLKHRLARDAIASAEEELHELLAGGDEEEDNDTRQTAAEKSRKWDLELVWKRTRLRVMVYMRLGEMEDDDEERYVKEEDLFHGNEGRFSQSTGLVSWAAAIFLTSILEYVAEQTLQVAGQAAYTRARRQSRSRHLSPADAQAPVMVEEHDVEKVALNSTLGRLWRTWRKSQRASVASSVPQRTGFNRLSNDNMRSIVSTRHNSTGTAPDGSVDGDARQVHLRDVPEVDYPEHILAANIPLPMSEQKRDVDEIEVPGMARDPDAVEEEVDTPTARRNSITEGRNHVTATGLPTPHSDSPAFERPPFGRHRSMSAPIPARARAILIPAPETEHHIPGAYPEESEAEDDAVQQSSDPHHDAERSGEDAEPDQKFNALEMAPHKRASVDARTVLDKVADGIPAEENPEQKEQSQHHGLVGGIVGAASAAAVAAAAAVYGSKAHKKDQIEEAQEGPARQALLSPHGVNVEELDKRKSLIDMKSFISPAESAERGESPEIMTSRKVYVNQPGAPPVLVRHGSAEELDDPYALAHNDTQGMPRKPSAKRQHVQNGDSSEVDKRDVDARTSGAAVADSSNGMQGTDSAQGGDSTQRPARLILGGSNSAMQVNESLKQTPGDFLQSRSLVQPAKDEYPEPDNATSEPPTKTQKRRSVSGNALTGNASQSPFVEHSPYRQSWTTAVEKQQQQQQQQQADAIQSLSTAAATTIPSQASSDDIATLGASTGTRRTPPAESQVHEHPIVQRMASMKRNANRSEGDPNVTPSLTSASIKAPEDFDTFISGADTVKYTLTPEAVRDQPPATSARDQPVATLMQQQLAAMMERDQLAGTSAREQAAIEPSRDQGVVSAVQEQLVGQPQEQALSPAKQPVELSSGPSVRKKSSVDSAEPVSAGTTPADIRTGRSAVTKQATSATGPPRSTSQSNKDKRRSISRPPPRNVSKHIKSGLFAREPRVMTESTRDFADFIRSTGPQKEQAIAPVVNAATRSTSSLHSLRTTNIASNGSRTSSMVGESRTKSLPKTPIESENIPPVPPVPSNGRSPMQSRAAFTTGPSTSELIDFIKAGPEQNGQHRIPLSVAPFRSTMDSDQLKDLGDRINGGGPPDLSLNNSSSPASSQTPMTSTQPTQRTPTSTRSATLSSNTHATVHPAHSGQPQSLAAATSVNKMLSPGGQPVRKRHRNKDPYAIDTDDDQDNDLLTALPNNKRQEESLIEFLNAMEPPKENSPRQLTTATNARTSALADRPQTNSINRQRTPPGNAAGVTNVGPRPSSIQSGNGTRATGTPAPPRPKMEARSPGDGTKDQASAGRFKTSTGDLADFLKNSAPDDVDSAPGPVIARRSKLPPKAMERERKKLETAKRSSFFARGAKKKTWLDMP